VFHQLKIKTIACAVFLAGFLLLPGMVSCSTPSATVPNSTKAPVTSQVTSINPSSLAAKSPSPGSVTPTLSASTIPETIELSLMIDHQNINSGESFVANLVINSKTPLRGAQWKTSFNPLILRCDMVNEGSFFKEWASAHGGDSITFPKSEINNTTGKISEMGIAVMTKQSGGASGSGIVCSYNFTALSNVNEFPLISDIQVVDVDGKMIKVALTASAAK
jgi:hypothetical protein